MIIIAGQIEGVATRKDRSIRLTIGTQELSPEKAAAILTMNQTFGYFAIKPEPFMKDETELLQSIKAETDNLKTPSQRLRAVLYRLFEQSGQDSFQQFYADHMEAIIRNVKSQLND